MASICRLCLHTLTLAAHSYPLLKYSKVHLNAMVHVISGELGNCSLVTRLKPYPVQNDIEHYLQCVTY